MQRYLICGGETIYAFNLVINGPSTKVISLSFSAHFHPMTTATVKCRLIDLLFILSGSTETVIE